MNTLCALRSLSFDLGARRLEVLLSAKTFWLERRGVCMKEKMTTARAAGLMQKQKSGRKEGEWHSRAEPQKEDAVPPDLCCARGH